MDPDIFKKGQISSSRNYNDFQNVLMCVLGAILIKIKASISPYTSNSSLKIILLPYQNHPIKMNSKWVTLLVIICHYFTKKGGGSNFQLFVTIYFVTIRLRREGVWCNLALVTNFPVFFYWRLPLAILLVLPALSSTNKIHRFPQTILIVVYGFLIPFY